jgi:hypothetical protein
VGEAGCSAAITVSEAGHLQPAVAVIPQHTHTLADGVFEVTVGLQVITLLKSSLMMLASTTPMWLAKLA